MSSYALRSAMAAFLILAAASPLCAQPMYRLPITITDINTTTGKHQAVTYFGVHPNGSNQMDTTMRGFTDHWAEELPYGIPYTPDMAEFEAPPAPPSGADIRVRNVTGNTLYPIPADIQKYSSPTQVDTFIVHAQPDDVQSFDTAVYQIPPIANQYADSIVLVQTALGIRWNMTSHGGTYVAVPDITFGTLYDFRLFLYHPKTPPPIPATVALISPADGALNQAFNPTLSWTAVAGAITYRYEVGTDTIFASPIKADTTSASSVIVNGLLQSTRYYWRVAVFTSTGMSWFQYPPRSFTTGLVGSAGDAGSGLPAAFSLSQNYPNPFNPATRIDYALPHGGMVRVSVFDLLGQEVRRLVDGFQDAGFKSVSFDASSLPGGIYLCRLTAGEFTAVRKLAYVK